MTTLLTNRKMSPALRARIERSVRGGAPARLRSLLRLLFVASIGLAVVALFMKRRDTGQTLERHRDALLDHLHAESATIGDHHRAALARHEAMLQRFIGAYEGDLIADEARAPNAFGRSIVYVHGPATAEAFGDVVAIEKTAVASVADAFVECLVTPPKSRAEANVLGKVRAAYVKASAPNVHRLADAYAGLKVLSPTWEARARAAHEEHTLNVLDAELDRAHVDRARDALAAETFLVAMDEPADPNDPAELDGERPHFIRVALVETSTSKTIVRARKRVDPSVWSVATRADFASGLDACAFAFDLREAARASR